MSGIHIEVLVGLRIRTLPGGSGSLSRKAGTTHPPEICVSIKLLGLLIVST